MPKNNNISKILIIGSGPIVIGQACEFDYSGVQACRALKEEGYDVTLINSNPATIMTDPEFAKQTYIEPINPEIVEKIIIKEKIDSVLPTLGGQTALNTAMALHDRGILKKHGVNLIGVNADSIKKGEDRLLFKEAMIKIGLDVPHSGVAKTHDEAIAIAEKIGSYPLIIRPAYTLGGAGGGIAYNPEEFEEIVVKGLDISPVTEVLVEESLIGWKEFEMEVVRDNNDNCSIICSIENFDPMGVHTGDSITVAPILTLTDKEYQAMRDASFAIIREIGVETGGANIQFSINPADGRMIVIEMNPRVSRSSALASKATGYPIARIAAKLAVGYTLDELPNEITKKTKAAFEPSIDYIVVKLPRFAFEKFADASPNLSTQMKSVGEVMAIGRTFKESMQKAIRSLETGKIGYPFENKENLSKTEILDKLAVPTPDRFYYIGTAFSAGIAIEEIQSACMIDMWFLRQIHEIYEASLELNDFSKLEKHKKLGFCDAQIAEKCGKDAMEIRKIRKEKGIIPTYRLVDTCAGEFEAYTPYYYSSYGDENEVKKSAKDKVLIISSGPNRIGQGIEFDYCCVHAAFALQKEGIEAIMINSNPETVSTDYNTSDRLYFEPLHIEDVLNVIDEEKPLGVIVQFGGQTPLNLAEKISDYGVKILGTQIESIDLSEDREKFSKLLKKLEIKQAPSGIAYSTDEARKVAKKLDIRC